MKQMTTLIGAAVFATLPLAAFAQTAGTEVQRNLNQQERIEQGLKSGQLTTREASRLEREESQLSKEQARAMKDGKLTDAEKARIQRDQNRVSQDIYRQKHDAQTGNPNSASSQRMQADVQRNINQQQRVEQGIKSGELNNREVAKLERGQSRVEKKEARAGADNHVGAHEQKRVQHAENHQSNRIYREKHDKQVR